MPEMPEVAYSFIQTFLIVMALGGVVLILAAWAGRMTTDLYDRIMAS